MMHRMMYNAAEQMDQAPRGGDDIDVQRILGAMPFI